jgi:MFS family permease
LISKISDRSEQGTVFGLYQGLGSVGRSLGPVIAGAAFYYIRDTAQFVIAGVMMAIVAGWLTKLSRMRPVAAPPVDAKTVTKKTVAETV